MQKMQPSPITIAWYKLQAAAVNADKPKKFSVKLAKFTNAIEQGKNNSSELSNLKERVQSLQTNPDILEETKKTAFNAINTTLGIPVDHTRPYESFMTAIQSLVSKPIAPAIAKSASLKNVAQSPAAKISALGASKELPQASQVAVPKLQPARIKNAVLSAAQKVDIIEKQKWEAVLQAGKLNLESKEFQTALGAFANAVSTITSSAVLESLFQQCNALAEATDDDYNVKTYVFWAMCKAFGIDVTPSEADLACLRASFQKYAHSKNHNPAASTSQAANPTSRGKITAMQAKIAPTMPNEEIVTRTRSATIAAPSSGISSIRARQSALFNPEQAKEIKRSFNPQELVGNKENFNQVRQVLMEKIVTQKLKTFMDEKNQEFVEKMQERSKSNQSLTAANPEDHEFCINKNKECIAEVSANYRTNHLKKLSELSEKEMTTLMKTENVDLLLKNVPAGMTTQKLLALNHIYRLAYIGQELFIEMKKSLLAMREQGASVREIIEFRNKKQLICENFNYTSVFFNNVKEIVTISSCSQALQEFQKLMLAGHYATYLLAIIDKGFSKEIAEQELIGLLPNTETGQAYIMQGDRKEIDRVQEVCVQKYGCSFTNLKSTAKLDDWMVTAGVKV